MGFFDKVFGSNEQAGSTGKKDFQTAIEERRSFYDISKDIVVPDERIREVVEHAVKHTPSAFNSQSARVVILVGEQHEKLWNFTSDALRKIVPADQFGPTEEKMNSFSSGYGTVLFFEDQAVVESLQQQFALYRENFPIWSQQSSGMLQYVVWTALELEGFGASLQHYNPLADEDIQREWHIPASWKLIAQMPFGKPVTPPGPKEYKPLEERVKFHK
ncbi:nitroreductase family protein [Bacillus sp. FJAT-42376]|uniref:nitroreductase family protein n=1 Tax=Bacillus sp. FJAT-42376 TaxID=2014076 RepID=UPI000F4F05EF|nr:nitroreductase family protein [Bacillus sp. FJAT-42376]AZB41620.1 nitroreductase family protein [Bacillus sp. FJAT-42376]